MWAGEGQLGVGILRLSLRRCVPAQSVHPLVAMDAYVRVYLPMRA
jgi:hypothetical protein